MFEGQSLAISDVLEDGVPNVLEARTTVSGRSVTGPRVSVPRRSVSGA
jgi:hypothetical protein